MATTTSSTSQVDRMAAFSFSTDKISFKVQTNSLAHAYERDNKQPFITKAFRRREKEQEKSVLKEEKEPQRTNYIDGHYSSSALCSNRTLQFRLWHNGPVIIPAAGPSWIREWWKSYLSSHYRESLSTRSLSTAASAKTEEYVMSSSRHAQAGHMTTVSAVYSQRPAGGMSTIYRGASSLLQVCRNPPPLLLLFLSPL